MEIAVQKLRNVIRCSRCRRHLTLPKNIRQQCPHCGVMAEYGVENSGRRVKCVRCQAAVLIPVHIAQRRRRRRSLTGRRRSARRSPSRKDVTLVPIMVTLAVAVFGMVVCFKLVASL